MPKAKNRVKYLKSEIVLCSTEGVGYTIKPLKATGSIFVCVYEGHEIEFELGEVGYTLKKKSSPRIPDDLYDMLNAYAFMTMKIVFAGYKKEKKEKLKKRNPEQFELF